MNKNIFILFILLFVGCEKINFEDIETDKNKGPTNDNKTLNDDSSDYNDALNILIYDINDTIEIYAHEQESILRSDLNVPDNYKLPNKHEVKILQQYHELIDHSDNRYLCCNGDSTYKFSGGSILKAGDKTKYSVKFLKIN